MRIKARRHAPCPLLSADSMYRNIILTGFMGTGKTSIGTRLAADLRFTFVDTDDLIETDQQMSISDIFKSRGEPYFRDIETKIIRRVLSGEGIVLSTGGGAVIRSENRAAFRKAGLVVCLTARPEVIFERVKHETHRPLLHTADPKRTIRELLEARAEYYKDADLVIDTSDKSIAEAVTDIKERITYGRC